ncbi:M48 metallopeptidase family protein [Jatrophihabitans sp. DSM 45814]
MPDVDPLIAPRLPNVPAESVEVRRSARRRRTVSAYRDGDRIVVLVPARLSKAREQELVAEMVERVTKRETVLASRGPRASDTALASRASQLSSEYLDARARPTSVRWVRNMEHRWGSCTPSDGTIRLSHRLQPMPAWVIDYVLMHELSHLLESGHGPQFWGLVDRFPRTERARGFLEGVSTAAQLSGLSDCGASPEDSPSADSLF